MEGMTLRTRLTSTFLAALCLIAGMVICLPAPAARGQADSDDVAQMNEAARLLLEAQRRYQEVTATWDDDTWWLESAPERVDPDIARREMARIQPAIQLFRRAMNEDQRPAFLRTDPGDPDPSVKVLWAYQDVWKAVRNNLRYRLFTGDNDNVASDLNDMLHMVESMRQDARVVDSLIGMVLTAATASFASEQAVAAGALSSNECSTLLTTLDETLTHDLFNIAEAFEADRERMTTHYLEQIETQEGQTKLIDDILATYAWRDEEPPRELASMGPAALEAAIFMQDEAMARAADICRIEDLDLAHQEMQRLADEIERGAYGPLAPENVQPGKLFDSLMRMLDQVESARATLEHVANDGEPADMLNAAIWYRRAWGLRNALSFEQWKRIEQAADPDAEPLDDAARKAMVADLTPIIDHLHEAAAIERCWFEPKHARYGPLSFLWIDYHDPMRDCASILRAAIATYLDSNNVIRARDAAGPGVVMIEHLAQDSIISTSDIAFECFDKLEPILVRMLNHEAEEAHTTSPASAPDAADAADESDSPNESERITLAQALKRINDDDPFGYLRSIGTWPRVTTEPLLSFLGKSGAKRAIVQRAPYYFDRQGFDIEGDRARAAQELRALSARQLTQAWRSLDTFLRECAAELVEAGTLDAIDAVETDRLGSSGAALPEWRAVFLAPMLEAAGRHLQLVRGDRLRIIAPRAERTPQDN